MSNLFHVDSIATESLAETGSVHFSNHVVESVRSQGNNKRLHRLMQRLEVEVLYNARYRSANAVAVCIPGQLLAHRVFEVEVMGSSLV